MTIHFFTTTARDLTKNLYANRDEIERARLEAQDMAGYQHDECENYQAQPGTSLGQCEAWEEAARGNGVKGVFTVQSSGEVGKCPHFIMTEESRKERNSIEQRPGVRRGVVAGDDFPSSLSCMGRVGD